VNLGYIARHLAMLNVQCDRCGRKGRYRTDKLLAKYGAESSREEFQNDLTRDCPGKKDIHWPFGKCFPAFPDKKSPAGAGPSDYSDDERLA
jgi:hypothetical protein